MSLSASKEQLKSFQTQSDRRDSIIKKSTSGKTQWHFFMEVWRSIFGVYFNIIWLITGDLYVKAPFKLLMDFFEYTSKGYSPDVWLAKTAYSNTIQVLDLKSGTFIFLGKYLNF